MASSALGISVRPRTVRTVRSDWRALAPLLAVLVGCWLVAAGLPLGCSIVAVFLFAGPHNWLEARYMLSRLPARWGPLAGYFALGLGGMTLLTLSYLALPWAAVRGVQTEAGWFTALALWNTVFLLWIMALALVRSRQNPRRDWNAIVPITLTIIALNWLQPIWINLAIVYLHPLLALWILDRELRRSKSAWRSAYHVSLLLLPIALVALWLVLANRPNLPGDDWLSGPITQHAGESILPQVNTHLLVATHVFLELLHYGVWIVAIPLVSIRTWPWQTEGVPLARRSIVWKRLIAAGLATGAAIMLALWGGFLADYPFTRNLYFTLAIWHVLAEVPFLLRLL